MDKPFGPQGHSEAQQRALRYVALEVTRRRADDVRGSVEAFMDNVFVSVGRRSSGTLGFFAPEAWELDERTGLVELAVEVGNHGMETQLVAGSGVSARRLCTACQEHLVVWTASELVFTAAQRRTR